MEERLKKYFGTHIEKKEDNRFSEWVDENDHYGLLDLESWLIWFENTGIDAELGMHPLKPQLAVYRNDLLKIEYN